MILGVIFFFDLLAPTGDNVQHHIRCTLRSLARVVRSVVEEERLPFRAAALGCTLRLVTKHKEEGAEQPKGGEAGDDEEDL